MENNPIQANPVTPPQTPATPPLSQPQEAKKGGSNKLLLVILGIFLFCFGLAGGYMLALNQTKIEDKTTTIYPSPTIAQNSPTPEASPTASMKNTKTVKAGMSTSQYAIEVPLDWTDVRENTQTGVIDKLTLSKSGYTLTIYQAAMGGGGCLYPGDAPAEMSQSFTDFVDIKGKVDDLRRSWNKNAAQTVSYTVCKKGTDGSYGAFSTFGAISAVSPNPADAKILKEIDSMLASMVKQ